MARCTQDFKDMKHETGEVVRQEYKDERIPMVPMVPCFLQGFAF